MASANRYFQRPDRQTFAKHASSMALAVFSNCVCPEPVKHVARVYSVSDSLTATASDCTATRNPKQTTATS